eukprot:472457_1
MSFNTDPETERVICDPSTSISSVEITSIVIASVMLTITILIAIASIKAMKRKTAMKKVLKWLFVSSMIALCTYLLCTIALALTCEYATNPDAISMIPMTVILFSYYFMALNLLGSLLYRLYITFDDSMYRISTVPRYILNVLFVTCVFLMLPTVGIYASCIPSSDRSEVQQRILYAIYCGLASFIFYIITAVIIVSLFAKNMLLLSKSRASSKRNITQENPQLNQRQMLFINQISRYVSLFSMAMLSTFVTVTSVMLAGIVPSSLKGKTVQLMLISISIDGTVNMSCLALQYTFTNEFYHRHCKWIECCWKAIFIKRTFQSMATKTLVKQQNTIGINELTPNPVETTANTLISHK